MSLAQKTDLHTFCVGVKVKIEKGVHSCLFGKLYVIIYAQNKFIEIMTQSYGFASQLSYKTCLSCHFSQPNS